MRLKLGDMDQATVYNEDPAAQARAFEDQGFEWLHVVDLNGAFAGESVNGKAVEAILKATKTRCSSAAASARSSISRTGFPRDCAVSSSARLPCAIRRW